MTPIKNSARQSLAAKEEERALKSIRPASILIQLSALVALLAGLYFIWLMSSNGFDIAALTTIILYFLYAGVLFWCGRLLDQRSRLAFVVYPSAIITIWALGLILRIVNSQQLFSSRDLIGLVLPICILIALNDLRSKKILT